MAAARKKPETWSLSDVGADNTVSKVSMTDLYIPEKLSQCEIIEGDDEDPADAGRKLALKLREARLI